MSANLPAQGRPFDVLMRTASGHAISRCLHVVADLGVADVLEETPLTAAELAAATGLDAGALGRVLRLLSAYEIFEKRDDRYVHTPASRLLRADHPQSLRAFVQMSGLPINWRSYEELHYSVRTGLPAIGKVTPGGPWKYFAENQDAGRIFNQAMKAKAQGEIAGVLHAYDFTGFREIGDIGGGSGHLLQAVLSAAPKANGVLFDLPHVIDQVSDKASERLRLQAGDFFKDNLPVCDAYIMMDVIHDWSDADSARILKNLRRTAPVGAKLLLIEAIIPDDSKPNWATILDILMLALAGGRQRTQQEHAELLSHTGFRLEREIAASGNFSILEAVSS
jgi:O-methyltransferase domain/Dimerisation domain